MINRLIVGLLALIGAVGAVAGLAALIPAHNFYPAVGLVLMVIVLYLLGDTIIALAKDLMVDDET